jgi:pimeloyl-ACP methyl ester carboxylesterase
VIKIADYKGGKIRYSDSGNGRTVVFLHGFLESMEMWKYYTSHLPKHIRTICIDLPGHGKSDNFGYNHSMGMMAECVHAVLKKEGVRKIVLVGHSMGGYAALAFAELYPDIIKGLVMFFSSATSDSEQKRFNRNRAIKLVEQNKDSFVRNSIPLLFAEKNRIKYKKSISTLIKRANHMGVQSIIASLGGMRDRSDREIILRFAPFPVKYIVGELDPVLPMNQLIEQSKLPEKAYLTVLKNTGHMGFIENKKQTFLSVKEFIDIVY